MVNFRQLISQANQSLTIEPRQLFQTLDRSSQLEYLRDVQGDVLDAWYERRNERDLVIKMNTGAGKTLVGLVLLWSSLKEGRGPALYLCPDRHLVSQVKREADNLGISHVDFESDNRFPADFHDSTAILITTVHRLFNGLSVFRVADRPDPVKAGTVLVDDTHACMTIIHEQFTATFAKQSEIGKLITSFFEGSLKQQSVGAYADIDQGKRYVYLRIPYWTWQGRVEDIAGLLSKHSDSEELKFVWPFLKVGEVLSNSTAAIAGDRIEIAPSLLPIELVPTFDGAPHRVYMSATLVDDAALVRNFAADPDSVQTPITPKVGGDVGERLIISPSLVDPNIEELTTTDLVSQIRSDHKANVVVLVPSRRRAARWRTEDSLEVPGLDIGTVVEQLCNSEGNIAIIANRYDGIDLPDQACRILVIDDLPQEHRLANLIEATSRRRSPILRRHVAQTIEQGMGRGVRSLADYCVVILTGKRLVSFITEIDNQSFFAEETKRQIDIGKELSSILRSQSTNAYQAILDLVSQCLNRDHDWQRFHRDRLQNIDRSRTIDLASIALASSELRAWQSALKGQYDRAAKEIGSLISDNGEMDDVDMGWYLQSQAEYLYRVDRTEALDKQLKAHELNRSLLKPPAGVAYRKMQVKQTEQAYAVLDWIQQSNEANALVSRANVVLDNLVFGISHDSFEQALSDLAVMIGFQSQRPDREFGRGPDVLWRMENGHHLVIEAKNEVNLNRQSIFKAEAEQLGHHATWFEQEYPGEEYTPILVHPSATLAYDAYLTAKARVIREGGLRQIVGSARSFVAALASRPSNQWTVTDVAAQIQTYQLRPTDFLTERLTVEAVRQGR